IEHRRVPGDLNRQLAHVAGGVPLEEIDLLHHLAVVAYFVLVGGEVAVPHQCHLLLHRMRRLQHPVCPPVPQPPRFEHRRPQPVKEAIGDWVQRTIAGRLDVDSHRDAALGGTVSRLRTTFRKTVQRRIPETRFDERLHSWIGDALVVHERAYRAVEPGIGQLLDGCRRSPKSRVTQEVRGAIVVPVGCADRREIVLPGHRPWRPVGASGHGVLPSPYLRNISSVVNRCPSTFAASTPSHRSISVAYTSRKSVVLSSFSPSTRFERLGGVPYIPPLIALPITKFTCAVP